MHDERLEHWALRLRDADDVAVLKRTIKAGTQLLNGTHSFRAAQTIPAGHKIALTHVPLGNPVRKYGQVIGFATELIMPGDHVHLHNLGMRDFQREYQIGAACLPVPSYPPEQMRFFD